MDANGGHYDAAWILAAAVTLLAIPASIIASPPSDLQQRYRWSDDAA